MLTEEFKKIIKEHSLKELPSECCGVFVRKNNKTEIIQMENNSPNPIDSFAIKFDDIQRIGKNRLIGFYHSHPEGDFSDIDIMFSEKLHLTSIIYKIKEDEFKIYEPIGLEIPLVGRPYFMGVFDCFSLVQDYYKRKFNIKISDFLHKFRYTLLSEEDSIQSIENQKNNCLVKHFLDNGFVIVNNLKANDTILIRIEKNKGPSSCMIYLANGRVLRQPPNDFSQYDDYGAYFKNRTTVILRHLLC